MKFFKYLLIIIAGAWIGYLLGPKPSPPKAEALKEAIPVDLLALENQINIKEKNINGIRPDNEARIIWADSTKKQKTKIAFVYIHGFSASQEEGDPLHTNIAKKYKANLYLARLAGHGINLGDSTMKNVTSDDFIQSAEEALAIGKKLGDEVVILATSFGGALSLYLASKHPEIKAMAIYSPCIRIADSNAELLDNHWGLALARIVNGSEIRDFKPYNSKHADYWCTHYHLNAVIAMQNILTNLIQKETFQKVKCPLFLGYWYKNEAIQDNVVSVAAMLEMFEQLGTPADKKQKMAFPEADNHVIGSYVLSKDYQNVEKQTDLFLSNILK
ncbi:MAG: alpha/beta hydrolase [Pseudarcicella sp.]|nr:alpha/beta hydrolase [Pseudarcicella sp.]